MKTIFFFAFLILSTSSILFAQTLISSTSYHPTSAANYLKTQSSNLQNPILVQNPHLPKQNFSSYSITQKNIQSQEQGNYAPISFPVNTLKNPDPKTTPPPPVVDPLLIPKNQIASPQKTTYPQNPVKKNQKTTYAAPQMQSSVAQQTSPIIVTPKDPSVVNNSPIYQIPQNGHTTYVPQYIPYPVNNNSGGDDKAYWVNRVGQLNQELKDKQKELDDKNNIINMLLTQQGQGATSYQGQYTPSNNQNLTSNPKSMSNNKKNTNTTLKTSKSKNAKTSYDPADGYLSIPDALNRANGNNKKTDSSSNNISNNNGKKIVGNGPNTAVDEGYACQFYDQNGNCLEDYDPAKDSLLP